MQSELCILILYCSNNIPTFRKWDSHGVFTIHIEYPPINNTPYVCLSRPKQAPRSGFQPRDESDKSVCGFVGPPWWNKKIDHERYVLIGSYELLVSNGVHQMNEKFVIQI